MAFENETLGKLLCDPRIAPIASDAIRNRDLSFEPLWNLSLAELREQNIFNGNIGNGMERLYRAAESGQWYFPLYGEKECEEVPARKGVNLVWFPSEEAGADERPFIFLVPGGGFVNVWNLTEGWPIAAEFNELGYHVFILTYQVDGDEKLMERIMQDFARGLSFIKDKEAMLHVKGDRYITCGFSAGGYLICLWNTGKGYRRFGLAKPQAVFPVYPVVTLIEEVRYIPDDSETSINLFGCSPEEAAKSEYEITEHVEDFPPCAIFVAAEDETVNPDNSRLLAAVLKKQGIPCMLEIGPEGGHGFADGSGMCMAGWTERAVKWYSSNMIVS